MHNSEQHGLPKGRWIFLLSLLSLFITSGCTSFLGHSVSPVEIVSFLDHPTNRAVLENSLGKPIMTGNDEKGNSWATYSVNRRGSKASTPGRLPSDDKTSSVLSKQVSVHYDTQAITRSISFSFSGGKLKDEYLDSLKKGITTRQDVRNLFGLPNLTIFDPRGGTKETWRYSEFSSLAGNLSFRGYAFNSCAKSILLASEFTFDAAGVLQSINRENYSANTYIKTTDVHHQDPPIKLQSVHVLKQKRLSEKEVAQLFGVPSGIVEYHDGNFSYAYHSYLEDVRQSIGIIFRPNGMVKSLSTVMGMKISDKKSFDSSKSIGVFAQSLRLAYLLAGAQTKIPLSTNLGSTQKERTALLGAKIDPSQLRPLIVGKTTPSDLVETIGLPDNIEWSDDGKIVSYGYTYYKSQTRVGTVFRDGMDLDQEIVTMLFDKNELLKEIKTDKWSS